MEKQFQTIGNYQGVDIYATVSKGRMIFVVWLGKLISSPSVETVYTLIDEWWKLRRN